MLQSAFVVRGHGYESGSQGRCEAFDRFEIVANPLGGNDEAGRASRSFLGKDGRPGVTYASHNVFLMREKEGRPYENRYFIAVHHGGGREVWRLPACHGFTDATISALVAMPERALYSLLWGMIEALSDTKRAAERDTAAQWQRAAIFKRIRTSRQPAKGRAFAWIEPERLEGESDAQHKLRCAFAKPAGVA